MLRFPQKPCCPALRLGSAVVVKDKFLRENFHDARKYWVLRDKKCKKCPSKLLMSVCIWIKKWQVSLWLPGVCCKSGLIGLHYKTTKQSENAWRMKTTCPEISDIIETHKMQVICDRGDHCLIMLLLMRPNTDAPGSQHNVSSW